mmetsp:Transcript_27004/g.47739  ORF Transcript_27004/g.47739 Transcript_27004/m.47739 type:complete len:92 (-) Transcript_27004:96-371(-)
MASPSRSQGMRLQSAVRCMKENCETLKRSGNEAAVGREAERMKPAEVVMTGAGSVNVSETGIVIAIVGIAIATGTETVSAKSDAAEEEFCR